MDKGINTPLQRELRGRTTWTRESTPLYSGNYEEEQHGQGNHHPFTAGTTRKNNMDKGINTPLQRELRGYNLSRVDCGSSVNQVALVLSADLRAV